VQIIVRDFSTLIKHQANYVTSVRGGKLVVLYEVADRKLPSCPYFSIITPAQKTDKSTGYAEAYQTISFVRAFLMLHFGKLLFYEWVADFDFDLEGKVSLASEVFRMPLYADMLKILDPKLAIEILQRLGVQQPHFRAQFQRACNFVSAALNQKDEAFRFSSYWIALEVLAQGTSGAIRARLSQAYGGAAKSFIDNDLRFSEIAATRHNLLHHGVFDILKSYHERLLQLYFWDIAIHRMNLAPKGLARSLVLSGVIEAELQGSAVHQS